MKTLTLTAGILALLFSASFVRADHGQTMCTMQYDPVCGARQVTCVRAPCYPQYETYGNSCQLSVDHATFVHKGECAPDETGPVYPPAPTYTPPAGCIAWFDGCNSCSKDENGQSMCTLRACAGDPAPGYCTAYAKPPAATPPSEEPPAIDTAELPNVTAPVEVEKPNFFVQLWRGFLRFLGY